MRSGSLAIAPMTARPDACCHFKIRKLESDNPMKLILTLAIVIIASLGSASATDRYTTKSATVYTVDYCAPYVVCTQKVASCRKQYTSYDHCGRPYSYWVTIVTYRDVYNTGATRTYTRTFKA